MHVNPYLEAKAEESKFKGCLACMGNSVLKTVTTKAGNVASM